MATLGIKKHMAKGMRDRERLIPHAKSVQLKKQKKKQAFKRITTKQKQANPFIAREAIYNHLIVSSTFLHLHT